VGDDPFLEQPKSALTSNLTEDLFDTQLKSKFIYFPLLILDLLYRLFIPFCISLEYLEISPCKEVRGILPDERALGERKLVECFCIYELVLCRASILCMYYQFA
jgi:hypothetical protein